MIRRSVAIVVWLATLRVDLWLRTAPPMDRNETRTKEA